MGVSVTSSGLNAPVSPRSAAILRASLLGLLGSLLLAGGIAGGLIIGTLLIAPPADTAPAASPIVLSSSPAE
jgi:hypothetical protein